MTDADGIPRVTMRAITHYVSRMDLILPVLSLNACTTSQSLDNVVNSPYSVRRGSKLPRGRNPGYINVTLLPPRPKWTSTASVPLSQLGLKTSSYLTQCGTTSLSRRFRCLPSLRLPRTSAKCLHPLSTPRWRSLSDTPLGVLTTSIPSWQTIPGQLACGHTPNSQPSTLTPPKSTISYWYDTLSLSASFR